MSAATSLTITNPLVIYRSLLAAKKLHPDPAQHRLALYLQDLYFRLKDYNPELEYRQRLDQATRPLSRSHPRQNGTQQRLSFITRIFSLSTASTPTFSLTRTIPLLESARTISSPRGLLLHGEVGRGKSMLLDLIYGALPSSKKRRYHFTTFMLDIFRRIERERIARLTSDPQIELEHVVLSLARESIATHPILFLDEFQFPDRASSKLLSQFLTSFFHLGGVLVASSNRMPDELAKAQGIEFAVRPTATRFNWRNGYSRWTMRSSAGEEAARSDFAEFLDVLKARCDVWEMEGSKDWRREDVAGELSVRSMTEGVETVHESAAIESSNMLHLPSSDTPKHYHVAIESNAPSSFEATVAALNPTATWTPATLRIYGRTLHIASAYTPVPPPPSREPSSSTGQIHIYPFSELCESNLGPADYTSIASHAHTIIIHSIPVLTHRLKNEARRFITLLDALYEARCRLLVSADAPVDSLFFPELKTASYPAGESTASSPITSRDASNSTTNEIQSSTTNQDRYYSRSESDDSVYSESYSEMYQDSTAPFRPNVSSYIIEPDTSAAFTSPPQNPLQRTILADEDADFGPTYGNGRSHGASSSEHATRSSVLERGVNAPDFTDLSALAGEDERFAYRRARSRLWEMCGAKWWDQRAAARDPREWWTPVRAEDRPWEQGEQQSIAITGETGTGNETGGVLRHEPGMDTLVNGGGGGGGGRRRSPVSPSNDNHNKDNDKIDKLNGGNPSASPYRTNPRPPPKFGPEHAWGVTTWGKKAGDWGRGVESGRFRSAGWPRQGTEGVGGGGGGDADDGAKGVGKEEEEGDVK